MLAGSVIWLKSTNSFVALNMKDDINSNDFNNFNVFNNDENNVTQMQRLWGFLEISINTMRMMYNLKRHCCFLITRMSHKQMG